MEGFQYQKEEFCGQWGVTGYFPSKEVTQAKPNSRKIQGQFNNPNKEH
jgi:hypothetical protein